MDAKDYNAICKMFREISLTAFEAAKGLRLVAKLINDSGVSIGEFMRRFVPEKD